jgi:hypothetical protein
MLAFVRVPGRERRRAMPTVKELLDAPHGLFVLGGERADGDRRPLWEVLAATCESLFLVGPQAEKPELPGPIRVRLLECGLGERVQGIVQVLRLDPHAVHVVGPADDAVLDRMVRAALGGCVAVVEGAGSTLSQVLDRLRSSVEPVLLWSALREIDVPGESRRPWTVTPAIREAGSKGAPTAELVG